MAYICGGSILDESHIVTAGHCFVKDTLIENYAIVVNDSSGAYGLHNLRKIKSFTVHPDYDDDRLFNDIAIIELQDPIEEKITAVTIASPNEVE